MCPALYSLEDDVCMLGRGWFAVPEVRRKGGAGCTRTSYEYIAQK